MFDAHVLKVFISTPGDTGDEVDTVMKTIHGWNSARAENAQVILLPRFWKQNAVPKLGGTGQSVVNSQLLDDSDIVIAIFDSRLGEQTETAVSGTAEEIERADDAGKPVHVWFSDEPIDRNTDPDELKRLQKFRKELEGKGLLGVYADLADLAYKVRDAVEGDVTGMGLGGPSVKRKGEHALPRLRVVSEVDGRGKVRDYILLENKSATVTAEQLQFDLGAWEESVYREDREPLDLAPLHTMRWPAGFSMGETTQILATITWSERNEPQSIELPVTMS